MLESETKIQPLKVFLGKTMPLISREKSTKVPRVCLYSDDSLKVAGPAPVGGN